MDTLSLHHGKPPPKTHASPLSDPNPYTRCSERPPQHLTKAVTHRDAGPWRLNELLVGCHWSGVPDHFGNLDGPLKRGNVGALVPEAPFSVPDSNPECTPPGTEKISPRYACSGHRPSIPRKDPILGIAFIHNPAFRDVLWSACDTWRAFRPRHPPFFLVV